MYKYVFIPKSAGEESYEYATKYEYSEIDVDNVLYKDLVDNLSFKKKFGEDADYPYVLYTFQGQGYMVHGPGSARSVFDLRTEVEAAYKKKKEEEAAAADAAAAEDEAAEGEGDAAEGEGEAAEGEGEAEAA